VEQRPLTAPSFRPFLRHHDTSLIRHIVPIPMQKIFVNLGCGAVFIAEAPWINFDYKPSASVVNRADLLARLPLPDQAASLVYSSHFLEHIPRNDVPAFLAECRRILAPGGTLRLVLPDLEEMCREFLRAREQAEHAKADFLVLEMIDQCVRREPGGQLGRLYARLASDSTRNQEMVDYVRLRTGEELGVSKEHARTASTRPARRIPSLLRRARSNSDNLRIRVLLRLLPPPFVRQNVSLAAVGERHHWLWDFHQLKQALGDAGFISIQRRDSSTSSVMDFPFVPLDLAPNGRPRKGLGSMYVEAQRPPARK
jgi:SAM-dependent methyltransferase